jgi:hypothetical protein
VLACASTPPPKHGSSEPAATAASASPSAPEPAPEPAAESATEAANAAIAQTLKFMAELRELPPRSEVAGQELSRDEMIRYVQRTLHEEVPPQALRATNAFLFLAGVVPADFDYERSLLKVMGTELAGFYDPKAKRMFLGADLGVAEQKATLAHELVHALQDQYYGLAALTEWQADASDRMSALHCLAEGDATSAMLDALMFGSGRTSLDLPKELLNQQIESMQDADPAVPAIVKRSVVAPYVDGLEFVHALRRRGGWKAVDEAWRALPSTTEQVLHPDKYFAREPGLTVAVPPPGPQGPKELLYTDIEGEQSLRLLLLEWLPRDEASAAASDWGGDRLALYTDADGRAAFAWHLRFDDSKASQRAFSGIKRWVDGRPLQGGKAVCRERADRGPIAAALRGADVAVVAGPVLGGPQAPTSAGDCAAALSWLRLIQR